MSYTVNTKNAYYPFGHIVPSESPHWAYYRFDWELPSRFADELMFKVRECAQFLTGELMLSEGEYRVHTSISKLTSFKEAKTGRENSNCRSASHFNSESVFIRRVGYFPFRRLSQILPQGRHGGWFRRPH